MEGCSECRQGAVHALSVLAVPAYEHIEGFGGANVSAEGGGMPSHQDELSTSVGEFKMGSCGTGDRNNLLPMCGNDEGAGLVPTHQKAATPFQRGARAGAIDAERVALAH